MVTLFAIMILVGATLIMFSPIVGAFLLFLFRNKLMDYEEMLMLYPLLVISTVLFGLILILPSMIGIEMLVGQ